MRCPFCYVDDTRVIDSRPADDGCSIEEEDSAMPVADVLRRMKRLRRSRLS